MIPAESSRNRTSLAPTAMRHGAPCHGWRRLQQIRRLELQSQRVGRAWCHSEGAADVLPRLGCGEMAGAAGGSGALVVTSWWFHGALRYGYGWICMDGKLERAIFGPLKLMTGGWWVIWYFNDLILSISPTSRLQGAHSSEAS